MSMEWKEADMRGYRKNRSMLEEKCRGTLSGPLSLDECALCGKSCALFKITSFPPVSLLARHTSTSNSATSGCLASIKILSKQINNLCQLESSQRVCITFVGVQLFTSGHSKGLAPCPVEHHMRSAVVKYFSYFSDLFYIIYEGACG